MQFRLEPHRREVCDRKEAEPVTPLFGEPFDRQRVSQDFNAVLAATGLLWSAREVLTDSRTMASDIAFGIRD